MVKRTATKKKKTRQKRHNVFIALLLALWDAFWWIMCVFFSILKRKPVVFSGIFFFFCVLMVVAYNAIFLQHENYKTLLSLPQKTIRLAPPPPHEDSIAALIEKHQGHPSEKQPLKNAAMHHDLAPFLPEKKDFPFVPTPKRDISVAEIKHVQAALRGFGNLDVKLSGVEDAATQHGVYLFQKMFSLHPSGKIDQEVLNKMRAIGLLK